MSVELLPSTQMPHVQPASPYQDDLNLAERIRAGEAEAKDEFAARCSSLFRQCASRSGLKPEDAEDVAQQSLLYAYGRLTRGLFRGDSALETWSYPIIRGQIIEHWQKQRRRERGEVCLDDVTISNLAGEHRNSAAALQYSTWETFEEWLDVIQALRTLSDQELTILLFNRTERCSVRELSEMLDLRETEVRRILYAAQEHLRHRLRGYEFSFKRHSNRLPAARVSDSSGEKNGRSIQARASQRCRHWVARCGVWLQRTRTQCLAYGLLLWPCRIG